MSNSVLLQIQGTWVLESMSFNDKDGNEVDLYGTHPIGVAMFDSNGYMNAQMGASGRASFAKDAPSQGTMDEVANAFSSYMAFFGKYEEQSPGVLNIRLLGCLFPNWQTKEMIRYASIVEDRLHLTTPPTLVGNYEIVVRAIWKRVP